MDLFNLFLVIGVLISCKGLAFADVIISPVNVSVSVNDSVTLTCTLTGTSESVSSFSWYLKPASTVASVAVGILKATCESFIVPINSSIYGYSCPSNRQSTWTIKKVTRENHEDRYQCLFGTSTISETSNFTFLNVQVPVSVVDMIIPNTSVATVRENTETVFKCQTSAAVPAPTIRWYKDSGTPESPGDDIQINSNVETSSTRSNDLIEVTSTIRYSPTRNENGWHIYCKASNIPGKTSVVSERKALLNVHYPPVIGLLKNRSAAEGTSLTVSCPVTVGNPAETTFEWKRDGHFLEKTQNFTIDSVSRSDAKFYTCKVANRMILTEGQYTSQPMKSFYLNVWYRASVASFVADEHQGQSTVVVNEHDEDIQFTCTVDSNSDTNVKIMFEGQVLKEETNTTSLSFVHSQIACLHSGVYICEGRNNYGKPSTKNLTLYVKCSPRPLYRIDENVTSQLHVPATLKFTALAYPEPGSKGFSWHKENGVEWMPVLSNVDLQITSSSVQTNMTILDVSRSDYGRYRLTVTNVIDSYVQYFVLSESILSVSSSCDAHSNNDFQILGIVLGIFCGVLTVYAATVTLLYIRNKRKDASNEDTLTKTRAYVNLNVTDGQGSRPERVRNDSYNNEGNDDDKDTVRQYMDLVRYSKDDSKTYDVITIPDK